MKAFRAEFSLPESLWKTIAIRLASGRTRCGRRSMARKKKLFLAQSPEIPSVR